MFYADFISVFGKPDQILERGNLEMFVSGSKQQDTEKVVLADGTAACRSGNSSHCLMPAITASSLSSPLQTSPQECSFSGGFFGFGFSVFITLCLTENCELLNHPEEFIH